MGSKAPQDKPPGFEKASTPPPPPPPVDRGTVPADFGTLESRAERQQIIASLTEAMAKSLPKIDRDVIERDSVLRQITLNQIVIMDALKVVMVSRKAVR